jgi:hypothetical protein
LFFFSFELKKHEDYALSLNIDKNEEVELR